MLAKPLRAARWLAGAGATHDTGLFAQVGPDGGVKAAMMVMTGDVRTHLSDERLQQLFDKSYRSS